MTTAVSIAPLALQQFSQNGVPLAGGKLFTYAAGTVTKQVTYTDSTGSTPNTNPIILDANGQCSVWLTSNAGYKFTLSPSTDTDPPTNAYWTEDNITVNGLAASTGSSLIGYILNAVGAVATTVYSWLQRETSVFDFLTAAQITDVQSNIYVDLSVPIQKAINTGLKLYWPKGNYYCNVSVPAFFNWHGDGALLSVIQPYSTATPAVMNLFQEPAWIFPSISDIGLLSTGSQVGTGFCFGNPSAYVSGMEICGRVIFNRVLVKNFNYGIQKPYGNIGNTFNQCSIQYNNIGYYAVSNDIPNPSGPAMHAGNDTFNGGEMHNNLLAAALILNTQGGGGQWTFHQTVIQNNAGFGILCDTGSLGNLYTPLVQDNVWFENNATAGSVTVPTTSGPQALTPQDFYITPATDVSFQQWGHGAGNGIGTTAPNAPLGIWADDRVGLNLINKASGSHYTSLGFTQVGSEATVMAAIVSNYVSGTTQDVTLVAGGTSLVSARPNGSVKIGSTATSASDPGDNCHLIYSTGTAVGTHIADLGSTGAAMHSFYVMDTTGANAASAGYTLGKVNSTSRSINAAGTINAGGTDYAEYMTKCGDFTINKGDICGIDKNGKLTNIFADAISFVVKSTSPSYVGGDVWGNEESLGLKRPMQPSVPTGYDAIVLSGLTRPVRPSFNAFKTQVEYYSALTAYHKAREVFYTALAPFEAELKASYDIALNAYNITLPEFETVLEKARQRVDRIAFSGQVPVNAKGEVGQYIVPVATSDGHITGEAVSQTAITQAQYIQAVGKVISSENGISKIIVKVT